MLSSAAAAAYRCIAPLARCSRFCTRTATQNVFQYTLPHKVVCPASSTPPAERGVIKALLESSLKERRRDPGKMTQLKLITHFIKRRRRRQIAPVSPPQLVARLGSQPARFSADLIVRYCQHAQGVSTLTSGTQTHLRAHHRRRRRSDDVALVVCVEC